MVRKKMKQDLTTGTWQDDTGCPISIILVSTSDVDNNGQQCGCKQWCLQLSVGHLRWFWHNSFVLWTYWHCPGAWFQRQRRWQGRQSEHWPRWGNFGESTMVDLLHWWVRMKSIHKYNNRQLIYWFGLTTRTFGVETFVFWPHIVW
jgi:hypothetical protein